MPNTMAIDVNGANVTIGGNVMPDFARRVRVIYDDGSTYNYRDCFIRDDDPVFFVLSYTTGKGQARKFYVNKHQVSVLQVRY